MNESEIKENYRQHRLRVQKATSLVDSQAPKPKASHELTKQNNFIEMLKRLIRRGNEIAPSKVKINCNRKCPETEPYTEGNKKLKSFPIPFHVWQRYHQLDLDFIRDNQILQSLLRPHIFLDLQINGQQPFGRLVIQLFTEACPEVVLQFIRTCLPNQHSRFHITRLLLPLWLEAELSFDASNGLNTQSNIEHDPRAINHGSSSGILSIPSRYLHGSKLHFITFTLSFTPIDVLNGKRIAFGIISCGRNVLERLQNLEVSKTGKPLKDISVSACGVLS